MNNNFFTTLFKQSKTKDIKESKIFQDMHSLSKKSNLVIYSDITIYLHKQKYTLPLIIYDEYRGLYLFEIKEWTYEDLINAHIKKTTNQKSASNTLAFERMQDMIRSKFNEIIHNDGVPIFNYLLMKNLSSQEYQGLDASLKKLLPQNKIIFSNLDKKDIAIKLQLEQEQTTSLGSPDNILGTLLTQYTFINADSSLALCNEEQKNFIDNTLPQISNLTGKAKSGKSSLLLLKSIVEVLKDSTKKVIIIKPTILSKDILHKHLMEIIEHGIIELDMLAIEVMTPIEIINEHLKKIKKKPLENNELKIDNQLLRKKFYLADIIMCDDANIINNDFIAYLQHMHKEAKLLLVNISNNKQTYTLNQSYQSKHNSIHFFHTNPHAKALNIVATLLQKIQADDIIIVSNNISREKLNDDLESFIRDQVILLDSSIHLVNQNFNGLKLLRYEDINEFSCKHVILLDICNENKILVEAAINMASIGVDILYEEDCQTIQILKEKYASN